MTFGDPHFRRGARDMLVFGPAMAAWGVVSGVAMSQAIGTGPAVLMSLIVFAGSAQLASLPLFVVGAPAWVICASAFCVNLRFLIFSAQWRTYLGHLPRRRRVLLSYFLADMNLVVFLKAWPGGRAEPGQIAFLWGGVWAGWPIWQGSSLLGIALASAVPLEWGLGFAGTLSMLGLAYGMLVDRTARLAAAVAALAAVAAFALPLKLNILVAIAAAVAVGVVASRRTPAPPVVEEAAT